MLKRILKDKQGSISLLTIITLSVLLPILLFVFVEYTNLMTLKIKYKSYNENIANTAITSIDENKIKDGIIEIDPIKAEETAIKMLIASYNLNEDLTLKENSLLKSVPILKVYTINETNQTGVEFTTDEGYSYTLYNPSVIIYTHVEPKGILFDKIARIKSCTVSQLQLNKVNLPTTNNYIDMKDTTKIYMENVINPYRFNSFNQFTELQWGFGKIPMSAGANIYIGTTVKDATFKLISVFARVKVTGEDYETIQIIPLVETGDGIVVEKRYRGVINIPETAPNGSIISLNIEEIGEKNSGKQEVIYYPAVDSYAEIGYAENNIKELLRINKIN